MRKSPFSTPRGNGGQEGYKWRSNERRRDRGYVHDVNNSFDSNYSPNTSQISPGGNDFIPFTTSSPSFHDKRQSGPFFGSRGGRNRNFSGSPGFRSDNHSPRTHFDNSYFPFKNDGRPSRGRNNKMFQQRLPARELHISRYIDLESFLEDPWKDLINIHNKSVVNENNSNDISINSKTCQLNLNNDNSELLNTSICSDEIQCQNVNEDIDNCSNNKLECNNVLSQDSVDIN